jgi:Bacterial regulatory proteins, lacI family
MSPEERHFIIDYAEQGYSSAAIAEALGRSQSGVADCMRREGFGDRLGQDRFGKRTPRIFDGGAPRVSRATIDAIISAGRRNTTLADVAREAGVAPQTAERVLQHHAPLIWRFRIEAVAQSVSEGCCTLAEVRTRAVEPDEIAAGKASARRRRWLRAHP